MPAYNQTLDLINTFGTKWQATPGLDLDKEIADLSPRCRPSGTRAAADPMAAPSVARPRRPARFSGLAWRRARWGYVFIAPWIIGFLLFTLFPMVATFVFTFTNINLDQAEPLRFVGLAELPDPHRGPADVGLPRSHPEVRAAGTPGRGRPAVRRRPHAPLAPPARHRRVPRPVLPALRRAVRGRRPDLGRDAGGGSRLDQRASSRPSGSRIHPTGCRTRPGSIPGLVIMGLWGIGGRDDRLPRGPPGHPDRALRRRADRRRRRLGVAAQHHDPDDVAGHLLHASCSASSRCSSTSSCHSCSRTARVSRAARRTSSTSTSTRPSSRSRTCPTARRSRGCCSGSRWSSRSLLFWLARRYVYYAGEAR